MFRSIPMERIRNILIGVTFETSQEDVSLALGYGISLAREVGARLTVQAASIRVAVAHSLISRFAEKLAGTENQRLKALSILAAENARGTADLAGVPCKVETPQLNFTELMETFLAQARVHDMTILDTERIVFSTDRALIEAALFDSGRPVLLVPPGSDSFRARRIIIAWDGSAQAARAVNEAMPLLRMAREVDIVSVIGEKDLAGTVPGAELAPHLSAHDVEANVVNLNALDGDVAITLRHYICENAGDIVVMGAYAHSWVREVILGGTTENLLKSFPVPIFMSC